MKSRKPGRVWKKFAMVGKNGGGKDSDGFRDVERGFGNGFARGAGRGQGGGMDLNELIYGGFSYACFFAGAVLIVGAWMKREKEIPDWLMAVGAPLTMLGAGFFFLDVA